MNPEHVATFFLEAYRPVAGLVPEVSIAAWPIAGTDALSGERPVCGEDLRPANVS